MQRKFVRKIQDLISKKGNTERAIVLLIENIDSIDHSYHNDIRLLSSQFHTAKRNHLAGKTEDNAYEVTNTRITDAILDLVRKLAERH